MRLFNKIFGTKKDERTINQLLIDITRQSNQKSDVEELYQRFPSMEVYFKIVQSNIPLHNGTKHIVGSGEILGIKSITLTSGQQMAQFLVDKSDHRLRPEFGGMGIRDAFEMVMKTEGLSGLVLCNPKDYWYGMMKDEIAEALSRGIV